jgi:restriction endonuclease Mrr
MSDAALLDEISGFEFEDLMADVFRKLGYENVRVAEQVADLGRDVIMEEVVDGKRQAIIVECKHTETVSRPVLQKLHSAIATYDFDGPKRGMVVTTGRFTGPAHGYADELRKADDPYPIELIDGRDLREIADDVGLDLYNGRIEVICDETLRPVDPIKGVDAPILSSFDDIENLDPGDLPQPESVVDFQPTVLITANVDAVFKTSVGVVHSVQEMDRVLIHATRGQPRVMNLSVSRLAIQGLDQTTELDEAELAEVFDDVSVRRFGKTETEYKNWAIDRLQDRHTMTVRYTGDNNVTYTKTCEPKQSDIVVQSIEPVYLPEIQQAVELGEYSYPYEYYAAGPSRVTLTDGIHQCQQCDTSGLQTTYTYCENCGSINCPSHIETERLEDEPVCTGCAVTGRFFFKTKYFYNEENREAFRRDYQEMPFYEKVQENIPLVEGTIILMMLLTFGGLVEAGLI